MENYNGELDVLFEEWINSYPQEENAKDRFCKDGLLFKFKDDSGYDINREWAKAERRIMFLLKDCPDGWGYDVRELLINGPNAGKTRDLKSPRATGKGDTGFFKNMGLLLHGLYTLTEENKGEDEIKVCNSRTKQTLVETFNNVPFAIVESKKLAGSSACPPDVLKDALEVDGKFLAKEIRILKPNIMVCCDYSGTVFETVVRCCFDGIVPDSNHKWEYQYPDSDFKCKLYYYESQGVLLFNSYHLTSLGKEAWKIYEAVMHPFRQFFARYKGFSVVDKNSINQNTK